MLATGVLTLAAKAFLTGSAVAGVSHDTAAVPAVEPVSVAPGLARSAFWDADATAGGLTDGAHVWTAADCVGGTAVAAVGASDVGADTEAGDVAAACKDS